MIIEDYNSNLFLNKIALPKCPKPGILILTGSKSLFYAPCSITKPEVNANNFKIIKHTSQMRWIKGYCAVHKAWHKVTKIILSRTISYLNVAKLQLKMTTSTMMLCVLYSKLLRLFPLNFVQDMNH